MTRAQPDHGANPARPPAAGGRPVSVTAPGAAAGGPLVPQGAAFHAVADPGTTRSYAFAVVPGFTLLAFSSAVEPLRIANQLSQQPLYRWQVLSADGGLISSSSGVAVQTLPLDTPLGRDTVLFVCAGNPPMAAATPRVLAAVNRHHRFGGRVGGICTGSFALAAAGLLRDRRFTLHWENQPAFAEIYPEIRPTANRFEADGKILTCGGGAASTDMMISLIAADHGADFAAMVGEMCLRTVEAGGNAGQTSSVAALLKSRNAAVAETVKLMRDNLEDPLPMDEIATRAGYSRRHLERMFMSAIGETPAEFYRGLRLDRGRNLLATTNMTLLEIATACGFGAVSHFSKCFKARFGTPPTRLKDGLAGRG